MNMIQTREATCPSSFAFDQLVAGEHDAPTTDALQRHLAACAKCAARVNGLRAAQHAFAQTHRLDIPQALGRRGRAKPHAAQPSSPWWRTWQGWLVPSAGLAAVAATALLVAQSPQVSEPADTTRIKGALGMTFYVQRDGVVGEGSDRDIVYPGDALRFSLAAATPGFAYLLGRDATGQASLYYATPANAAVAMGGEPMLLPDSIVLDQTLGREAFWGVHCVTAQAPAELIAQLSQTGALLAMPGCTVATLTLEKHARR